MTRVLQAMAGGTVGGAEAFFERLVPALARSGVTQSAVIRTHPARAARLARAGVPVQQIRYGGPLDLVSPRRLRTAARRFAPRVVLAWMSRAASMAPRGTWTVAGRLGGYYDLKYYKRCDHLIGNTRGLRDYIVAHGWPADRAWYLPNFVDAAPQAPADRAALDTPQDAHVVVLAGRLHHNKGVDVALEALARLPDSHLWIAGSGPLEDALRRQAASLGLGGRAHFLGWRDDVPALIAAADCLLCASRHEPLGNVVLEGWAHGTPVVAAAAQGPSELIVHQKSGLLVPVEDSAGTADAIAALARDEGLRDIIVAGARAAHERDFSEAAVVARYRDFFDRVAR